MKDRVYVGLAVLFAVCIATANLLSQKFVLVPLPLLGEVTISSGVLIYPLTFLISDIVAEIYGKQYTDHMIHMSFCAGFAMIGMVYLADTLPAASFSPVDDPAFHRVFGNTGLAFIASFIACMLIQFLDVRIFLWLKAYHQGKHLWFRNNVSTIFAQSLDTATVLTIICLCNILPWEQFMQVFFHSFWFKVIFALADTPFCYLGVWLVRRAGVKSL